MIRLVEQQQDRYRSFSGQEESELTESADELLRHPLISVVRSDSKESCPAIIRRSKIVQSLGRPATLTPGNLGAASSHGIFGDRRVTFRRAEWGGLEGQLGKLAQP